MFCIAGAEIQANQRETVCVVRDIYLHRAFLEANSGATLHQIERGSVMVDKGR